MNFNFNFKDSLAPRQRQCAVAQTGMLSSTASNPGVERQIYAAKDSGEQG